MRPDEFITRLRKNYNIGITVVNNELKISASKEVLTPAILAEIKERKIEIIEFYTSLIENKNIPKSPEKELYSLTPSQKRLYFLNAFDKDSLAYNMPRIVKLIGQLDTDKLKQSFYQLIERHEVLRTRFVLDNNFPFLQVLPNSEFDWEFYSQGESNSTQIVEEFKRPFDLEQSPLFRVGLVCISENEHLLLMDIHHIITDGISQSVFTRDLLAFYHSVSLPPLSIQYKDYSEWLMREEQQKSMLKQKDFWLAIFEKQPPLLELPADFKRPSIFSSEGALYSFVLNSTQTQALRTIAENENTTVYTLLLTIYNVFLFRICGQNDFVVGTPVSGRQHVDLNNLIGMFVNTLPIRNFPQSNQSFSSFLTDVKLSVQQALANQSFQFEDLIEGLNLNRDTSRNPLFDTLFVFNNFDEVNVQTNQLEIQPYHVLHTVSKLDLTLEIFDQEDQLMVNFEYPTSLFRSNTIYRFGEIFQAIVTAVVANQNLALDAIEILSTSDLNALEGFQGSSVDLDNELTVLDHFRSQVLDCGEAVALRFEGVSMSYLELDERSNRLAHYLLGSGVEKGSFIPLCLSRSFEMVIGILGILKSGCAYVPIDPEYPVDRINYIVSDTASKLVLGLSSFTEISLFDIGIQFVSLDTIDFSVYPSSAVSISVSQSDLAYIIYTSGTTGRPKGVMNEHGGLYNRLLWMRDYLSLTPEAVILQKTTYCFDVSVWEFLLPLICGSRLVLAAPGGQKDSDYLQRLIYSEKVNLLHFVPSMLSVFLQDVSQELCASLKYVVCSGEELKPVTAVLLNELLPEVALHNLYGPTEAAIDVTAINLSNYKDTERLVPIGKPVWNTNIYIVDGNFSLQSVGLAGELLIGGIQVARGYLNRPELTEEKFIEDTFSGTSTGRLYRTGDLARWLPDGNIEYMGRIDNQIKLRGYRIELGEIENCLTSYAGIDEAAVVLQTSNDQQYLVGYYISESALEADDLRSYLQSRLPEYMVPMYYLQLERMPLTSNGKLDRKSLPEVTHEITGEYIAPRTAEERMLSEVWSSVLGLDQVGIYDNFFSIGGDSIKSIQISSRLRGLGYDVRVKELFTYQTIAGLSANLRQLTRLSDQSVVEGSFDLSPIQRWFMTGPITAKHHFNQSVLLSFVGFLSELEVRKLFGFLQNHHDALRMVFDVSLDTFLQRNVGLEMESSLSVYDLRDSENALEELSYYTEEVQSGMDLSTGPLMRLGLYHFSDRSLLLVSIHHLVVDGVSWRILFEDIETLYGQIKSGSTLKLPPKTDSFKYWVEHLEEYKSTAKFTKALSYWTDVRATSPNRLQRDHEEGRNTFGDVKRIKMELSEEDTKYFLTKAHIAFNTQANDLLVSALLLAINRSFGLNELAVAIEGHGREDTGFGLEISRTVGWFTTIYPVILRMQDTDLSDLIRYQKEQIRIIPNNGLDYLLISQEEHDPSALIPSVSFNYLGQFDTDLHDRSFTIANDAKGADISPASNRPYDLDIGSIVTDGKLQLSVDFSPYQFDTNKLENFGEEFKRQLVGIIHYCIAYEGVLKSPSDMSYVGLSLSGLDELQSRYAIEDIYTLSPMQEGMLFHSLYDPTSTDNFLQMTYHIEGDLDIAGVEWSMNQLLARYEVLRSVFLSEGYETPLQVVLQEREIDFKYADLRSELLSSSLDSLLAHYQESDRLHTFRLDEDVLMRLQVLRTGSAEYEFIWSCHHILMDGWCMGIIIHEFSQYYSSYVKGVTLELPATVPYSHYITWLSSRDQSLSSDYWSDYLKGYTHLSGFPSSYVLEEHAEFEQSFHELEFDTSKTALLTAFTRESHVTMNTFVQACWGVLLSYFSSSRDVVFGSVVSGRPSEVEGIERMVGLFINTIPVRVGIELEDTVLDLLQRLQQVALSGEAHHYHPLSDIQSESVLGRDLFDHIMVLENFPISEIADSHGLTAKANGIYEKNQFNLTLFVYPEDNLKLRFVYNSMYYSAAFIDQLSGYFMRLAELFVNAPRSLVSDLSVVSDGERWGVFEQLGSYKGQSKHVTTPLGASYHQERLWFIDKFESGYLYESGPVYHNIPLLLDFKGKLDYSILERSLAVLLNRYSVLRTRIVTLDERPYQYIDTEVNLPLSLTSWSAEFEENFISLAFELDDRLVRAVLTEKTTDSSLLLVVFHHTIADRYSCDLLAVELLVVYQDLLSGLEPKDSGIESVDYADFSLWQQNCFSTLSFDYTHYWRHHLGKLKALEFPTDRTRDAIHIYEGSTVDFKLDASLVGSLEAFSKQHGVTLEEFLFAGFNVLLRNYCGHQEIVVGTSVTNRLSDAFPTVGPVSNLIVLKSIVDLSESFVSYLQAFSIIYRSSLAHSSMPFDKLVKELAPDKDMSRTALFDVLFEYTDRGVDFPELENLEVVLSDGNRGYGKYDLNLFMRHTGEGINGYLAFNTDYSDGSSIEALIGHYIHLLEALSVSAFSPLSSVSVLIPAEELSLLRLQDKRSVSYPLDVTLLDLFASQVKRTPEGIALEYGDVVLTYRELDELSNRIGNQLVVHGVVPESLVCLLMDRTDETVVSMLGILKAGGAYVPIDVDYPLERKEYILSDSGSSIVLTNRDCDCSFVGSATSVVYYEDSTTYSSEGLTVGVSPSNLCYVIYTSGTTGQPKGVMLEHVNVVRLFDNSDFGFSFGETDVWTMFHSHCFDFSVWEMYGALLFGGKLIVVPKSVSRDTDSYLDLLIAGGVTVLNQTPSAFYNLIQQDELRGGVGLRALRYVIFGGESLNPSKLKRFHEKYPSVQLINMYGITETTVHVTYKEIMLADMDSSVSAIGSVLPTLSVCLLSSNGSLVPQGVIGELYVGGAGLSRGYLGKPDLTNERFVVHPYDSTQLLYRSGDLARLNSLGELEYIGRIDHQVQLRGFRIELGEIEHQLEGYEGIEQVAVVVRGEEQDQVLVAYYVSPEELMGSVIRTYLLERLPDYMVPSMYVHLSEMPLTPNGKVDKKVIAEIQPLQKVGAQKPKNETQKMLITIWSKLLNIEKSKIGIDTNFFELGGNSLLIVKMVNEIYKEFNLEINVATVFANPMILMLASYINNDQLHDEDEDEDDQMNTTLNLLNHIED